MLIKPRFFALLCWNQSVILFEPEEGEQGAHFRTRVVDQLLGAHEDGRSLAGSSGTDPEFAELRLELRGAIQLDDVGKRCIRFEPGDEGRTNDFAISAPPS